MKRILTSLLALTLASVGIWAQNKNAKPAKTKPAMVDCSTTTDGQITDNVKAKLASTPSLKDQSINVASSAGMVTLTGKVKTSSAKGLATRMAKSVDCVKKVDNKCEAEVKAVPPKAKNKNAKPKN